MIIRRLGVLSVARISALIAAFAGLLLGLAIFLASLAGGPPATMTDGHDPALDWITGMGALAIIAFPILYAIAGFIGGAIQALLYNIAAKFVGGVRIETP